LGECGIGHCTGGEPQVKAAAVGIVLAAAGEVVLDVVTSSVPQTRLLRVPEFTGDLSQHPLLVGMYEMSMQPGTLTQDSMQDSRGVVITGVYS